MNDDRDRLMNDIGEGERWLSSLPRPEVSPAALLRIKSAVRAELQRSGAAGGRWSTWHGVLAAAASIALAVLIGWHSAEPSVTVAELDQVESSWLNDAGQDATAMASLEDGLSALEEWSQNDVWDNSGPKMYDTIQGLNDDSTDDAGDSGASLQPWHNTPVNEELS
jgi:hypothetical protein